MPVWDQAGAQVSRAERWVSAGTASPHTAATHGRSPGSLCPGRVQRKPVLVHSVSQRTHTERSLSTYEEALKAGAEGTHVHSSFTPLSLPAVRRAFQKVEYLEARLLQQTGLREAVS